MAKTLLIGFNWPQNEQYAKLCKAAKHCGLTFQKYVISQMTLKANNLKEIDTPSVD